MHQVHSPAPFLRISLSLESCFTACSRFSSIMAMGDEVFHASPAQTKVAYENALLLECITEISKVTIISDIKLFLGRFFKTVGVT